MFINQMQNFLQGLHIDPLLIVGAMVFLGFYFGKAVKLWPGGLHFII